MDWKEFFKPTLGKILIFILLALFSLISGLMFGTEMRICTGSDCKYDESLLVSLWKLLAIIVNIIPLAYFKILKPEISDIQIMLFLVWYYLVACMAIFVYNKFKPKK